jgi:hypothetical protein
MIWLLALLVGCKSQVNEPLCPEDEATFQSEVWEPVLGTQCVGCHVDGGLAASTDFVLDPDDMLASLRAFSQVSDRILLKPTGLHEEGHGGGQLIELDSPEYAALAFWVDWNDGTCAVPALPSCDALEQARRLRRLSHAEYDRTIADLLGIDSDYGQRFAADPVVDGFANDAEALELSPLLADQYRAAAEEIAGSISLNPLLPCDPYQVGYSGCAALFIEDFGYRAFRRPLVQSDVDRYLDLWTLVATEDGFDEGLRWVLTAMLQSPHFLYRSELGVHQGDGVFQLTDWEIASELSYTFWGTMPDEELLAIAGAGELQTPEQIQAQAQRLASDPRVLETAADMVEAWLLLDRLQTVSRDGLDQELRDAMRQETRDLIQDIASDNGSLADLMQARHTFVDEALADHYGLAETGEVPLDGERYGGLLTQGSLLTTYALPTGSSPIHRGVLVRERLLCEELPPPPSNLDTSPPAVDPNASTRERYTEHSANPQCASCHEKIDPIGFGFEHYDGLGRWRATEEQHPIDASGDVDGQDFDGVAELSQLLLEDTRFRSCFATTWERYATGVESCAADPGDVRFLDPLIALPTKLSFRQRIGTPLEGDTFSSGDRLSVELPEDDIEPGEDIEFSLTIANSWTNGYCADGLVINHSVDYVKWEVSDTIDGTINSIWNATYHTVGTDTVFSGDTWNTELAPGTSTTFGFCADL